MIIRWLSDVMIIRCDDSFQLLSFDQTAILQCERQHRPRDGAGVHNGSTAKKFPVAAVTPAVTDDTNDSHDQTRGSLFSWSNKGLHRASGSCGIYLTKNSWPLCRTNCQVNCGMGQQVCNFTLRMLHAEKWLLPPPSLIDSQSLLCSCLHRLTEVKWWWRCSCGEQRSRAECKLPAGWHIVC